MPRAPLGTGMACTTNQDCPAAVPGAALASVCAMGHCTQCGANADCPAETPVCSSAQSIPGTLPGVPSFRLCVTCQLDRDCPAARPHCSATDAPASCVACVTAADCAQGVCANGACVPGCSAAQPCANPLEECSARQRCEALSCTSNASCPPNLGCAAGHCQRRACSADAECDKGGACVNGACYETRGKCFVQMFAQ